MNPKQRIEFNSSAACAIATYIVAHATAWTAEHHNGIQPLMFSMASKRITKKLRHFLGTDDYQIGERFEPEVPMAERIPAGIQEGDNPSKTEKSVI